MHLTLIMIPIGEDLFKDTKAIKTRETMTLNNNKKIWKLDFRFKKKKRKSEPGCSPQFDWVLERSPNLESSTAFCLHLLFKYHNCKLCSHSTKKGSESMILRFTWAMIWDLKKIIELPTCL